MKENSFKVGRHGENIAEEFLVKNGFNVIQKNFHTRYGEVDIICMKGNAVYFYEVKYRKNERYGLGEEAISKTKISKLRKSIEIWVTKHRKVIAFDDIYLNALVIDNGTHVKTYEIN
jgi:putative endonuclease